MRRRPLPASTLLALLAGLLPAGCGDEGARGKGPESTLAPARAARYIAAGGSDEHDGNSPASAWRTIAKVNAAAGPDETIRFRRSEVFADATLRAKSGQVVEDFGDAAEPAEIVGPATGEAVLVAGASEVTLRRIRIAGGEGSKSMAVGLRLSGGVDRLRVEDVEFRGGRQNVLSASDASGQGLVFERCRFVGSWHDGVHLFGRAEFAFRRCRWERIGMEHKAGAADPISAHDEITFVVEDSEFRDCQRGAGLSIQRGKVRFARCLVVTPAEAGGDGYVFALDTPSGTMQVDNCVVILRGPGPRYAFLVKEGTLEVRHCTVINDTGNAGSISFADAGGASRSLQVTNCISVIAGGAGAHVAVPAEDRYTGAGNCFWPDGPRWFRNSRPAAWADWSTSEDTGSLNQDPALRRSSATGDARDAVPSPRSPCIGAGRDAGIDDDHSGRSRPHGPPTIGALEPGW